MKGSKSKSGQLAFGNGNECQNQNMHKWYGYVVPRKLGSVKRLVSTCPRSSQAVNGSHFGK